jgi:DHA2 family multidrug resistance protein
VLCGGAQTLDQIILFRIIQGMFGAALVPLSQTLMLDIYPVEQRGSAMAIWATGVTVGPVLGPILGGWLTESYSWRWVFFVNIPFGVIAALGLFAFLPRKQVKKFVSLDWVGFCSLSLAIGALQTLLDRGEQLDWFNSPEIVIEACLCGLGLYIFLVQIVLAPKPFISLRLLSDLNFLVGITFIFMVGLTLFATMALLAPYVQQLMNYPVITAGLTLAPRGGGTMLSMIICGRLVGKVDARLLASTGITFSVYALYEMERWTPDISQFTIIWVGLIQGLSIGFIFVPLSITSFATLPLALRAEGAGIYSLMRNLGSSIGISITAALLEINSQINHAIIAGNLTPFDRQLQMYVPSQMPELLSNLALLNGEVTRQAQIIAYDDDFRLMLILNMLTFPLVFLIGSDKEVKPVIAAIPEGKSL